MIVGIVKETFNTALSLFLQGPKSTPFRKVVVMSGNMSSSVNEMRITVRKQELLTIE